MKPKTGDTVNVRFHTGGLSGYLSGQFRLEPGTVIRELAPGSNEYLIHVKGRDVIANICQIET